MKLAILFVAIVSFSASAAHKVTACLGAHSVDRPSFYVSSVNLDNLSLIDTLQSYKFDMNNGDVTVESTANKDVFTIGKILDMPRDTKSCKKCQDALWTCQVDIEVPADFKFSSSTAKSLPRLIRDPNADPIPPKFMWVRNVTRTVTLENAHSSFRLVEKTRQNLNK